MEVGISLTTIVPIHLSVLSYIGRGTGTETCKVDNVFTPDDLSFGSDTNTNVVVIYYLHVGV